MPIQGITDKEGRKTVGWVLDIHGDTMEFKIQNGRRSRFALDSVAEARILDYQNLGSPPKSKAIQPPKKGQGPAAIDDFNIRTASLSDKSRWYLRYRIDGVREYSRKTEPTKDFDQDHYQDWVAGRSRYAHPGRVQIDYRIKVWVNPQGEVISLSIRSG